MDVHVLHWSDGYQSLIARQELTFWLWILFYFWLVYIIVLKKSYHVTNKGFTVPFFGVLIYRNTKGYIFIVNPVLFFICLHYCFKKFLYVFICLHVAKRASFVILSLLYRFLYLDFLPFHLELCSYTRGLWYDICNL